MVSRIAVASRSRFDILQQDEIEQSDPEDDTKGEIESAAGVSKSNMMCAPFSSLIDAVPLIFRSVSRATPMKTIQTQPDAPRMTKEGEMSIGDLASKADGVRPIKKHSEQRIMLEAPRTEVQADSASQQDLPSITVPTTQNPVT
jgi:hypothetical protein